MRLLFIMALLVIFSQAVLAQGEAYRREIDSLEAKLNELPEADTARALIYSKLALYARDNEPLRAVRYAVKGIELSKKINYEFGRSINQTQLGIIYFFLAEYDKSLTELIPISDMTFNPKKAHQSRLITLAKVMVGNVYRELGQADRTVQFINQAMALNLRLPDKRSIAYDYKALGEAYLSLGKYDKALECAQKALDPSISKPDTAWLVVCSNLLGAIYWENKQYVKAKRLLEPILTMSAYTNRRQLCVTDLYLGKILIKEKQIPKGIAMLKKSLDYARSIHSRVNERDAYLALYEAFKLSGDQAEALRYHELLLQVRDTLSNEISLRVTREIQSKYDVSLHKQEIKKYEKSTEEDKIERIGLLLLVVAFLSFSIFTLLVLQSIRRKRKEIALKNKMLEIKNTEINQQKEELGVQLNKIALQNEQLERQERRITDSIRYATTIQQAALPDPRILLSHIREFFVIYKPKDIVSGDFYWFTVVQDEDFPPTKVFIAVADCTGHGVPGGFMSMIGISLLNEVVEKRKIFDPAEILESMDLSVRQRLNQSSGMNTDGIDMGLCVLESEENSMRVRFAGAERPMCYVLPASPEVIEVKGTKRSLGGRSKKNSPFQTHDLHLPRWSLIYLYTDGIVDQLNPRKDKLGSPRWKSWLSEFAPMPAGEQKTTILQSFHDHQSHADQLDDVTAIGLRL
jgi:serine phosphatase RsbU (regulator of sigma subunit)